MDLLHQTFKFCLPYADERPSTDDQGTHKTQADERRRLKNIKGTLSDLIKAPPPAPFGAC